MRVRRAVWRIGAPAVARAAPRLSRRYYDAVTRSLVRALAREPAVRAVYAHGSYADGRLVPGRSDVDLVAVLAELEPREEAAVLRRLGAAYRARQAALPLDLLTLDAADFERAAGWVAFTRVRIGSDESHSAVSRWRLLAGEELRGPHPWEPNPALAYVTEAHVTEALAAGPAGATRRLELLARDLEREGLDASALRSTDPVTAVVAALAVADEHRARHGYATRAAAYDTSEWRVESPPASRDVPRLPARSTTLIRIPFQSAATLLVEADDVAGARPLVAAALHGTGTPVVVTTTRLAEDSWRSGLRWIAVASGRHLAGEPLAPRLVEPATAATRGQLLEHRAFAAVASVRRYALGMRTAVRCEATVRELALVGQLARGEPPDTVRGDPAAALADEAWVVRGLEAWRETRASLVGEQDPFGAHPVAVE